MINRILILSLAFTVASCASAPRKPATYTPAPSLTSAIHSTEEAKDFLSRAGASNDQIRAVLERWGREFK